MFGKSRFLGLRGLKLNIVIGFIAGLDFLYVDEQPNPICTTLNEHRLFGYDQGVMGGLLDLPSFV